MIETEIKVTEQVAAEHGLTGEEYARIQKILGREPNITELGIFSVMWSEHCSYKSSRVHLKRLPTTGARVVQGPGENAGVVDIGDGLCAVFKIESHNHPSFVEPFQGAATGVGGILRDIFTMGARPIAVLDSLRFGPILPPQRAKTGLVGDPGVGRDSAASEKAHSRSLTPIPDQNRRDWAPPPQPAKFAPVGGPGVRDDSALVGAGAAVRMQPAASASAENSVDAETIARNRRIVDGVVRGIGFYGNCFGVPTVGGEVQFEECYSNNPLVNALALGIARREELFFARARGAGNPVIYVGAKTGRDGIHGASLLASAEFSEESEQKRPNVQVGDPFMEKLLLEACLEAMKTGAVVAIQDMGAAGLTSSSAEMASRGGMGIEIDLARVPQRETGMTPYEMMLSESQERMLLVAERGREREVFDVFEKWGLDAVEVGRVTEDGTLRVLHQGRVAAEIPAHALAEEGPRYERAMSRPAQVQGKPRLVEFREFAATASGVKTPDQQGGFSAGFKPRPSDVELERATDEKAKSRSLPVGRQASGDSAARDAARDDNGVGLTAELRAVLGVPEVASKYWITEQYDSMVQTNTRVRPGEGDAAVLRLKESKRGLAIKTDGNGRWCKLAPRLGAMHAVVEAARNVACAGARPVAATNCLNFGNPEKPEVMWQFSEAVDGIAEACKALDVPITGGNVSFYNETLGKAIYPTPVLGVLGVIEDASCAMGSAFRAAGDAIVVLDAGGKWTAAAREAYWKGAAEMRRREAAGEVSAAEKKLTTPSEDWVAFSSSEYAKTVHGIMDGTPPAMDLAAEKRLIECLVELAGSRTILSAHDVSDGGLAVTLAESSFGASDAGDAEAARARGRMLGADVTLTGEEPAELAIFGERGARAVVSVAAGSLAAVESIAAKWKVSAQRVGTVTGGEFRIQFNGQTLIEAPVESLRDVWAHALPAVMTGQ